MASLRAAIPASQFAACTVQSQCATVRIAAARAAAPRRATGGPAARLPASRPATRPCLRADVAAADAQFLTACPPAVGSLSKEERDQLAKEFGFR